MTTQIKKTLCFAGICFFLQTASFAQSAFIKAADEYYSKGDFYSAAQLYEKAINGEVVKKAEFNPYTNNKVKAVAATTAEKTIAQFKLAESYYQLRQFEKAEPNFKAASEAGNAAATYYFAKTQQYNGKQADAEAAYKKFTSLEGVDPTMKADAELQLKSMDFAKAQMVRKDLARYSVSKAGVNSVGATYAPANLDGKLVFTSTRTDAGYSEKNPNTNKLYLSNDAGTAELLGVSADENMEQGIASFYGNAMYYTKWQLVNGKKQAGIYKAEKSATGWNAPVMLGTTVNAAGASSSQPNVTADGKWLLFSSDMAGGMGKKDIWAIGLDGSGNPTGNPINLKGVNGAGDDEAPFYHSASKTLVFATNGRVGMGGYDLFTAKGEIAGTMAEPVNMGYPVNSVKDDIYYMSTDAKSIWQNAYLSSDRSSECCLDLFTFNRATVKKSISGTVVDCNTKSPVPGVGIIAKDNKGNQVFAGTTDANGAFSFPVSEFMTLQTALSVTGYEAANLSINASGDEETATFKAAPLCINKEKPKPVEVNTTLVLNNVLYDFGKSTLSKDSYPVFDTLVSWMNEYPEMKVEISAHTDDIGTEVANQKLSEKRAESCVAYMVSKGISRDRFVTKGYGETMPIEPNKVNGKDNPEGRKLNRRTELKVLNY